MHSRISAQRVVACVQAAEVAERWRGGAELWPALSSRNAAVHNLRPSDFGAVVSDERAGKLCATARFARAPLTLHDCRHFDPARGFFRSQRAGHIRHVATLSEGDAVDRRPKEYFLANSECPAHGWSLRSRYDPNQQRRLRRLTRINHYDSQHPPPRKLTDRLPAVPEFQIQNGSPIGRSRLVPDSLISTFKSALVSFQVTRRGPGGGVRRQ